MSPETVPSRRGFSILELLAAMAVLSLILVLLLSASSQIRSQLIRVKGKAEQFREARQAFEAVTRRLSQATLNTYWDYDNPSSPKKYLRQSELRFISGNAASLTGDNHRPTHALFFQAPLGSATSTTSSSGSPVSLKAFPNLLNTCGYFVEFGNDSAMRPPFITADIAPYRNRYRLKEMIEPSENLTIYKYTSGTNSDGSLKASTYDGTDWFTAPLAQGGASPVTHVLAENILSLVLLPKLSAQDDPGGRRLSPNYSYDSTASKSDATINSRNQLPPVVQVTMVAIDEASARRLENGSTPPDFGIDLSGLFTNASNYASDLKDLEQALASKGINYRVFSTDVAVVGSKWSRSQSN